MEKNNEQKESKVIKGLSELGGTAVGASVGTGVGLVVAGPGGAALGAIAGSVVEKVFEWAGAEISERFLSKKENQRVKSVLELAKEKVQKNLANGQVIRDDDFFDKDINDRSTAEEILEGVLLTSQKEYEERKLVYLANLYSNIAFDKTITRQIANQLIKIAAELTYRQLVILKVIGFFQTNPMAPTRKRSAFTEINGLNNVSIASDIYALYQKSLVFSSNAILDAAGINPSTLSIGGYGALLYNLMGIADIPLDEMTCEIIVLLAERNEV